MADDSVESGGPLSKVLKLLSSLEAKIIQEGKETQQVFDEFGAWCQDRSKNIGLEIQTGKAAVADLSAAIEKENAKIGAFSTKIEELSGSISSNEADMKAATKIRESETSDFAAEEKESLDVISTLERAIAVMNRAVKKGSASMLQLKGVQHVAEAMDAMVQASVLSSADAARLSSLVQSSQDSQDGDGDATSDAAASEVHNDGIVGTLENLLDKAETQLEKARKNEATNAHNYAMLQQSLEHEIAAGQKDMEATKQGLAASQEAKSTNEGDFSVTTADLKEDTNTQEFLKQDCMTGAEDFEAETKSRAEELKALAQAKGSLGGAVPAAVQTYGAALDQEATFLQLSQSHAALSEEDHAKLKVVRFIRDLAHKEKSAALAQLASRMTAVIRYGDSKVKTLISTMIEKLEQDAKAEASHDEFCNKETSEAKAKKEEKMYEVNKLGTRIDSMSAKSAKLKEEVATLQGELREMTAGQAEMDKLRLAENHLYTKNKAEMQAGISGVQKALSILRDYYAADAKSHNAAGGASTGIIGMLEVVESDFSKSLSDMDVAESTAKMEYDKTTYINKVSHTSKTKDLEHKAKEAAGLDKSGAESSSDKDGVQAELDALDQYLAKLEKMCIAKAEPYAERKARREEELAGLKEALVVLEEQAAMIQQSTSRRAFRGKHSTL